MLTVNPLFASSMVTQQSRPLHIWLTMIYGGGTAVGRGHMGLFTGKGMSPLDEVGMLRSILRSARFSSCLPHAKVS